MKLSRLWGHINIEAYFVSYCRWEFLRRNGQYRTAYDAVQKKYPRPFPPKVVDAFIKRWGIYPYSYSQTLTSKEADWAHETFLKSREVLKGHTSKKYRDVLATKGEDKKFHPIIPTFFPKGATAFCLNPEIHVLGMVGHDWIPTEQELAKTDYIDIRVHLGFRRETVLKEVLEIIERWQERRVRYVESASLRYGDFKEYWKLYDARIKDLEVSWAVFGTKYLKKKKSEVTPSDVSRLDKAFKKCEELIDGGYRKIIS